MTADPTYAGVVWTGEEWVSVAFGTSAFDHAAVADEIGEFWLRYEEFAERILVGLPIGLFETDATERDCDRLARDVLGPLASTVHSPPIRPATRKRRYQTARKTTERKTGATLSEASFELSDGIAALDELLQELPEARQIVAESHPELCFRAFAGEPLTHSRAIAGGYAERMRTLAGFDSDAVRAVQQAAEDLGAARVDIADVIDATALAYTARPGPGTLRSLPGEPRTDPTGLPIQLLYRADQPLDVE
jgi:predicted RNase H-like nuclease